MSVQIVIFPIMIYFYKNISFTFLISNILTSYIISLIIILGFMLILISFPLLKIATILGKPYQILIKSIISITSITSKIPFSKVYIKVPYTYQIILYYLIIFISLYLFKTKKHQKILKYKKQIISIIIIIILIPNSIELVPTNRLKIYFIDVGQGDSCLIVTPQNKTILIDGGGSENYDIRRKDTTSIPFKQKNKEA